MMRHSCKYCSYWYHSRVIKKNVEEESGSGKKRKKSNFKATVRKCKLTNKKIKSDSPNCKWFSPSSVYCNQENHLIKIINCLDRRRNEKGLTAWDDCRKCRQFDQEIKDIAETYWLNAVPIKAKTTEEKQRKKIGKIKRREKSEEFKERKERKRTIKRRPSKIKRKIKRRKTMEDKPTKRKIKRRVV